MVSPGANQNRSDLNPNRIYVFISLLTMLLLFVPEVSGLTTQNITPTQGFTSRQTEYASFCFDNNGPDQGGTHGQVVRVAMGADTFNTTAIYKSIQKIINVKIIC